MLRIKKYILPAFTGIFGGVSGFLYWYYIGCQSGTCPITSSWYSTVIFGSIFGYLVGDLIKEAMLKRKKNKQIDNN